MVVKQSHSYFVVMRDYGKPYIGKKGPSGLEAVINPEHTRRDIVAMIRSGELRDIAFIHAIEGLYLEDLTAEIMAEAGVMEEA